MKKTKNKTFDQQFSDNFVPNSWEKFIQKWETSRTNVICEFLPPKIGVMVDLACGDCKLIRKIVNRCRVVFGFDISRVRIKKSQQNLGKLGQKVNLKYADLDEGIPLKNNSVNIITCEASLNCFIRPDLVLSECWRVLKPNGSLIIQVPNYAFLPRRIKLLIGKMPTVSSFSGFGDGGMFHNFTYESLAGLLTEKKFQVYRTANSGLFADLRKIWPTLLAGDIIYEAKKIAKKNK